MRPLVAVVHHRTFSCELNKTEALLLAAASGVVSAAASAATSAALFSRASPQQQAQTPPERIAEWRELNSRLQFEDADADDGHRCDQDCHQDLRRCLRSVLTQGFEMAVMLEAGRSEQALLCLRSRLLRLCRDELGFALSDVEFERHTSYVLLRWQVNGRE